MASSSQIVTSSVLGKRKTASGSGLVLHLAPSDSDYAGSESDAAAATSAQRVVIDKRPYLCTHPGCSKAYSKPSRLAEHERSHTGEVRGCGSLS
jgi:general transcription factor IIIA